MKQIDGSAGFEFVHGASQILDNLKRDRRNRI
jgi:hypothetical protein